MLWFESNGSHRHLRVTLLIHWVKVGCAAFTGISASSFDRRRLKRVGFSREVSRDAAFTGVSASDFDRRRLKRVGFSREVSRGGVGPFPNIDLALSATPCYRSGRGALISVVAGSTTSVWRRGNAHE